MIEDFVNNNKQVLKCREQQTVRTWLMTGVYPVKSAYFGIMENLVWWLKFKCFKGLEKYWLLFWKLSVPQKGKKHVVWRNLCTFLSKLMTYENECHLFFRCNRAVEVWTDAALWPVMEHSYECGRLQGSVFPACLCYATMVYLEV